MAAEQGEQLELAGRALHLRPELTHRVEDQEPLVVRADDVARREVVAVARERERLVPVMCCLPGLKYAPEKVSCICGRHVHVDAADAVDEADEPGEVDVDDVRDLHAEQPADVVRLRRADRACSPALILSPSQHVSRGMSSIVAWCLAGFTPSTCSASPRAPPTPGRESLPTNRMKNGARRCAADAVGGRRAVRSSRRGRYVAPDAIGSARRPAKIHAPSRPRCTPSDERTLGPAPAKSRRASRLIGRRIVVGPSRGVAPASHSCRGRGRGSRGRLADRLHAVRGDVPGLAGLGERQLDVALDAAAGRVGGPLRP